MSSTDPAAAELCPMVAAGGAGLFAALSPASAEIGRVADINRPRPTKRLNGARDGQFMMEFSLGESWWTADSFCLNTTERDRGL